MATETTKKLRNWAHIGAGLTFSYSLVQLLNIKDFPEWQYYGLSMILGALVGLICGLGWDVVIMKFGFKEPADPKDIMLTTAGGLIGGVIAMFCKDLTIISTYMVIACILGMAVDIYRAFKKEK